MHMPGDRRGPLAPVRASATAVATALLALSPAALTAQATEAAIVGTVRGGDGAPLARATVVVRNTSTGYTGQRLTDERGQFRFAQLPLGGPYVVSVRLLGHRPATRPGLELHLGDRVPLEFRLERAAAELQPVVVTAAPENARAERFGASTPVSAREIATIPAVGRNFTDLAVLSPLVGSGLSLSGDKEVSTGVAVDGLSVRNNIGGGVPGGAPYVLSLEAIREFEIATNVYDVTLGRQGGGSLNAATKSGTNDFRGSLFLYNRNNTLAGPDYSGRRPDEFGLYQWGGSLGGPIVRDRAHFFVALDRQDERQPYRVLDVRNDADALAAGVHADSIARLRSILESKYGAPAGGQLGAFTRRPVSTTGFARVDWQVSPGSRLTVRGNVVDWFGEAADGNSLTLREAYADRNALTYNALASLATTFRGDGQNELKFGVTSSASTYGGLTPLPKGIVRIRSTLTGADGRPVTTTRDVTFGGNSSGFNEGQRQRNLQLVNTTRLTLGGHRLTFGVDQMLSNIRLTQFLSRWGGTFNFNSLADLEALRPSQFSRKVPVPFGDEPLARVNVYDGAAFAQTEWEPAPRLRAMAGLRYDVTSFLTAARYNPEVERALGLRTDHNPTDWDNVQPRFQLTWDATGDGRRTVRLGGGRYSAQTLYLNQANNLLNPGNLAYTAVLTGAAAPRPDFPAYRADPSRVPVPDPVAGAPEVNLVSRDFEMPTTWKGNLAVQQLVGRRLTLGVNLLLSRTADNYHYFDRNLVDAPRFTIEGGRGVFVPPERIDARGVADATRHATKTPAFGRVRELVGAGAARQRAVVLDGGLRLPRASAVNLSYTWNEARDNSSYNCCAPGTATNTAVADDPRDLSKAWGYSDVDFRHKVVAYGALPSVWGFRLSGRYVARSGTPVSLVVGNDVNGDGTSGNDLAFVFDPDDPATPPEVAASMRQVLANPDNRLRDYIRANLGRIAERNGGRAPWRHNVDLRLAREFRFRGQRSELLVDIFNAANRFEGRWGGYYNLDNKQALLTVTGFDQATKRYTYDVNESIGVVPQKSGSGYQMQLGVRHEF
jgi:hypothetical protein